MIYELFLHQTLTSVLGPGKIQKKPCEDAFLIQDLSVCWTCFSCAFFTAMLYRVYILILVLSHSIHKLAVIIISCL